MPPDFIENGHPRHALLRVGTKKRCRCSKSSESLTSWVRDVIEDAIRDANVVVAPDGIAGNLIFRTLVFLGGGGGFGTPVLADLVFVDTSRVKVKFSDAIMLASALTCGVER